MVILVETNLTSMIPMLRLTPQESTNNPAAVVAVTLCKARKG
jgi:hypothetical protein